MFKPLLAMLTLILSWTVAVGQEEAFRDDHPDSYVVQRGDTLWDISQRFLDSPWLWPEIWHANPQIDNPHLIFPGDVITMVYVDGVPRLTVNRGERRVVKLSPGVRSQPRDAAIGAIELRDIQPYIEKRTVLNEFNRDEFGYIVANEEGRLYSQSGLMTYVRNLEQAEIGDHYAVVRPTVRFVEIPPYHPWETSGPRRPETQIWEYPSEPSMGDGMNTFWRSLNRTYWESIEILGYEVEEVAVGQITAAGDPATLTLSGSNVEVAAGDLVVPISTRRLDARFFPSAPSAVPTNSRVIGMSETLYGSGKNQVVAINKGAEHGIEPGNVFAVYRGGEEIRDTVRYPKDDVKTFFSPTRRKEAKVKLPDEYAGLMMVFETFDRVSYGLIMESVRPIRVADHLYAP